MFCFHKELQALRKINRMRLHETLMGYMFVLPIKEIMVKKG